MMQVDGESLGEVGSENELFNGKILEHIDTTLTNEQFVQMCIKRA